jgi:DNA invertase Pin-like site-specific DNA recombinase
MFESAKPLIPKKAGGPLVAVLGRLSKEKATQEDTDITIESSMAVAREYIKEMYKGPIDFRCLGEQISGLIADRETIRETYDLAESGYLDLVIGEELRCTFRNPRLQYAFVQDMVDMGVRFISIADNIDTADEDWEMMLAVATLRHGLTVPDTRRRVRRTATAKFHEGGMAMKVGFGYRKLTKEEARSGKFGPVGLREAKIPEHTPIIHEIRRRLMETKSPMAVLVWLRKENVPVGPYVKLGRWTMQNLKLLCCQPKLHGCRIFRRKIHTRIYSSGKFRRDSNPEPEQECVPELAHMTREEQETMLAAVGWHIRWNDCQLVRPSPRRGISRYKCLWPGRSCQCGICKLPMVISGDHLRCPRCLKKNGRTCWNRVEVPLDVIRNQVHTWLLQQFDSCAAARQVFVDAAWIEIEQRRLKSNSRQENIRAKRGQLKKQIRNINRAIQAGGKLKSLVAELKKLEAKDKKLRRKLRKKPSSNAMASCVAKEEVAKNLGDILMELMRGSYDFNQLMRKFFPEFVIVPVQALDTDQVHPRGKLLFVADPEKPSDESGNSMQVSFDLFTPPVHISLLPKIQEAYAKAVAAGVKASYRSISETVGTSYMTVKRARNYERLMQAVNTTDPFRELTAQPAKASRWRVRSSEQDKDAAA